MPISWKIEKRKVSELKIWDKNPRTITSDAFEKLKKRITERGFHDIVKIDIDNTILSGNQRKRALQELGIEEVNVIVPDRKLTDEEQSQVALESNRNDGEWDWDKLANEFDEALLGNIGFSEEEIGNAFVPDFEPATEDEQGKLDEKKKVKCPSCGHEFEA